ncbi:MAG: DEAD/DEAH box helicase, partial [Erysipelotrichia bacterium]|nr:DEAD/DEAH box helicase [Erysipelotrichia bacterium]
MQNVFEFRNGVVKEYESYSRSFVTIRATDIDNQIDSEYKDGRYWPDPLIQINPGYKRCETVQQLVSQGLLHPKCGEIFKLGKNEGQSRDMQLYQHQLEAIAKARSGRSYVLTTGTGSGKSMAFFIPIIDKILKGRQSDPRPRTRAIIIYPMNALANSQLEELKKFLHGFPAGQQPFTVERYTGQESSEERQRLANNPPDILLTNFMMLELILTRYDEKDCKVVKNCQDLEFLILDELHTYRGRQGADVAMLVRRVKQRTNAQNLLCIGTSATMANTGSSLEQQATVAQVASKLFGTLITSDEIITETLERITNPALGIDSIKAELPARLRLPHKWANFDEFRNDPLAVWVELNMGIALNDLSKPTRARPITIRQAAEKLAKDTSADKEEAILALQSFLINAHSSAGNGGLAPFAFKLHQFISGPGKVHTTLEPEGTRQITLDAQIFAPGRQQENVKLFSTYFCRACGHEYHPVW